MTERVGAIPDEALPGTTSPSTTTQRDAAPSYDALISVDPSADSGM